MDQLNKIFENIQGLMAAYGLKILGAVLFFIVGLWITNWIAKGISKIMSRRGWGPVFAILSRQHYQYRT